MKTFQELIDEYKSRIDLIPPKKTLNQRQELFAELYNYYEKDYKRQAWKGYVAWLKQNRFKHTKLTVEDYKKNAFKKITVKSFVSYWLGFIPTQDLWYLVSIAKDMDNRGQSFNRWLFWAIKVQDDSQKTI